MENEVVNDIKFIRSNNLTTPVAFYSESKLLEAYHVLKNSINNNSEIYFALKSCYNSFLLNHLSEVVEGAEVMSELEYEIASRANFKDIIVNGLGRSGEFLKKALSNHHCIIIDSLADIKTLDEFAQKSNQPIRLGIRIKLNIDLGNYYDSDNKLGTYPESDIFKQFIELCNRHENITWEILHSHFTINEINPTVFVKVLNNLEQIISDVEEYYRVSPLKIDIGGGFEVYDPENKNKYINLFSEISECSSMLFPNQKLVLEPGRYLSAYSGYTIGKVLDVKKIKNKYWVVSDISTNVLIPIQNARYKLIHPTPAESNKKLYNITVTDGVTSPTNNVISEIAVAELPRIGSYICIGNTGAYTDVYSTFWSYGPHQILTKDADNKRKIYRSKDDILKWRSLVLGF